MNGLVTSPKLGNILRKRSEPREVTSEAAKRHTYINHSDLIEEIQSGETTSEDYENISFRRDLVIPEIYEDVDS